MGFAFTSKVQLRSALMALVLGPELWLAMVTPSWGNQIPAPTSSARPVQTTEPRSDGSPRLAQNPDLLGPLFQGDTEPPSTAPLPIPQPLPPLPPPEELLQPSPASPIAPPGTTPEDIPQTITVERFEVLGSTVFGADELAAVTAAFINRPITFRELFEARAAVTQLYVDRGYVTSGAYIPQQTLDQGVVQIQVIEGRLDEINVTGNQRLNPAYVRSRLGLAGAEPLNIDSLLQGLQLLQLDPLINTISAELGAGVQPGTSILNVAITEADAVSSELVLDNDRSPSVGSFRREAGFTHGNLTGLGDRLSISYANTEGSNSVNLSYTLPVSPSNATLNFGTGLSGSRVIEEPFDILNIESSSRYYELTYRQPIIQTPSEDFALSLTISRRESESEFLGNFGPPIPFPSLGADAQGRTRISALRFTQEWTQRGAEQVLAVRSQFSFGLGAFGATISDTEPDSQFFSWRGQGQWIRLLAPETLLVVRADLQLTPDALLAQEQMGLGGLQTVRGYRQDQVLTDNGILASAEVRVPILRVSEVNGILHVIPFVDFGMGWNNGIQPDPDPNLLVSTGLGLQWQMQDNFFARLDWGIPLTQANSQVDSLQENGLHFSIRFNPF
jgi:hemolysin activation/secretion protein